MRVFKPKYQKKGEAAKKLNRWYVDFTDHVHERHKFPAFADKRLSEALGRQVERLVALRVAGESLPVDALKWIEGLPSDMVVRFVKWGLLPKEKAAAGNLLSEHLEQWRQAVSVKNTGKHADLLHARAKRVFAGCGFRTWTQIDAAKVQKYLNELRKDTLTETDQIDANTGKPIIETKRGISAQTFNFYVQAVGQFCKWMIQSGKANGNPLAYLPKLNVKTDRRHDRRALDIDEIQRLYGATIDAGERFGMTGHQRYICYRLAIESGLRASEMRSLRPMDFDLEGLTVTVRAAYSKNRTEATIPLRKETAEELRGFLRGLLPTAKVFAMPKADYVAKMLRADLESAGIEYRDESGRVVDFHGLRHTTASLLAQSGAHPKVAQQIMRHSTVELTLGRYSHIYRGQESQAVEALPSIEPVFVEAVRTGTDDQKSISSGISSSITKRCLFSPSMKDCSGQLAGTKQNEKTPLAGAKTGFLDEKRRGRDSNPRCGRLPTRRFSKPLP